MGQGKVSAAAQTGFRARLVFFPTSPQLSVHNSHGNFLLCSGETVHAKPIEPDRLYLAEVEIGTPPQRVNLAVDTGSPDV